MAATLQATVIQNAASSSPNITLDTLGNIVSGGTLNMPSSFMRNRFINGSMMIWQRGTSFSLASPSSGTTASSYTADRWVIENNTGTTATVSQQANSSNAYGPNPYYISSTCSSMPSGDFIQAWQVIESQNISDLAGQTVTLSFYASYAMTGGTPQFWVYQAYPSVADNWGSTITISQVATITPSSTSATRYTITFTLASGCVNGLRIYIGLRNPGSTGSSVSFGLGSIQIEAGSIATPFERRLNAHELSLSQRYYQKSYIQGTVPGSSVTSGAGGVLFTTSSGASVIVGGPTSFPVTMRTSPTLTVYDNAGTSGKVSIFYSGSWSNGVTPDNTIVLNQDRVFVNRLGSVQNMSFDYTVSAEF